MKFSRVFSTNNLKVVQRGANAVTTLAVLSCALLGCFRSGSGPNGAVDPERQSRGEYGLAVDALNRGQTRTALVHVNKAIELDDENADAHLLLATVYIQFCTYTPDDCRLSEAEKSARKALKLRATFREARNTLGSVLINEKKYAEAIEVLKPLADDIEYATPWHAWGNLGWAYLEKGEIPKAVDALRRAIAAQPFFCWGHQKLALAYEKKGDFAAAEEIISTGLSIDQPQCKNFADAYETRARFLTKRGAVEDARSDLEKCTQLGAGSPVGRRCAASLKHMP
jgi:type IV pilus assembly protein PilF